MIDMPPLKYADINGIRMGYYAAGPDSDAPPMVLCHGWPELAFSWRHQIKALADAGIRVIAPDQRGYGASSRPDAVGDYDLAHLTDDLAGLLDHLKIEKAIFVGHDWGGFVVWEMALRHPARVAGVVGVNTPHLPRPPIDPIAMFRKRFGDNMYIVQFQDPAREPDRIFSARTAELFDCFMRKPMPKPPGATPSSEIGGGTQPGTLAFPQIVAAYDGSKDPRPRILDDAEMAVFVDTFKATGFTGGINWYRNFTRNWQMTEGQDRIVRAPALMIMAENDAVLPPSAADNMEALVPDLDRHLVRGSGHWTQQERPEEVSRVLIDWRRKRFG